MYTITSLQKIFIFSFFPLTSSIDIQIKNNTILIKKLSLYITHKTLGCNKSPLDNNKKIKSKKKSNIKKKFQSNCNQREKWIYFFDISDQYYLFINNHNLHRKIT